MGGGGMGQGTEFDRFYLFLGSSEAAMGGGGAQRPVGRDNESKKTGARSARARTRGQNPLVINKQLLRAVKYLHFLINV
jgi:hypothetical protein